MTVFFQPGYTEDLFGMPVASIDREWLMQRLSHLCNGELRGHNRRQKKRDVGLRVVEPAGAKRSGPDLEENNLGLLDVSYAPLRKRNRTQDQTPTPVNEE